MYSFSFTPFAVKLSFHIPCKACFSVHTKKQPRFRTGKPTTDVKWAVMHGGLVCEREAGSWRMGTARPQLEPECVLATLVTQLLCRCPPSVYGICPPSQRCS